MLSAVDFWAENTPPEDMKLLCDNKMYPPNVTILVCCKDDRPGNWAAKVIIEVEGVKDKPLRITWTKTITVSKYYFAKVNTAP
jgi:hypothetical protein